MEETDRKTLNPIIVESWGQWVKDGCPLDQLRPGDPIGELGQTIAGLVASVQEARFIADKKHAFIEKQSEALTEERARAERAEAALRTLEKAGSLVRQCLLHKGYTDDNNLSIGFFWEIDDNLDEDEVDEAMQGFQVALEQARAALPGGDAEG